MLDMLLVYTAYRSDGSRRSRDVQSIQVQLTSGQTVLVALDDNIVVRTVNNNPFTFEVSPNNPKQGVHILQLIRIEVEGKGARARVFGYGRYYRSDSRSRAIVPTGSRCCSVWRTHAMPA